MRSQIIDSLKRSRKYAGLCSDTLTRVADWAAARHKTPRNAIKAAKRKLHQVYGAYLDQLDLKRVEELVASLPDKPAGEDLRATCREILGCHASTAERLPIVDGLYSRLFSLTGAPATIVDLACGLHPFSLPWMGLSRRTCYHACDIDHRLVAAINAFLGRTGQAGAAECRDMLASPPELAADVALLLKTAPCLEQQEKGATVRLLRGLRARHAVLSFPARTLGGRDRGMQQHYGTVMRGIAEELRVSAERLAFPDETFYVLPLA